MDLKELENQNQDQEENQNQNQNENQDHSSTNDDVLDLLRATVQETNARARNEEARRQQLERELEELRRERNAPAKKEITAEDYFADPVQVLRSEIAAQLAPLTKFAAETKKQTAYNELKSRFLADAKYGPLVIKLGAHLDNLMSNLEPTEQNMFNAVHSLIGQLAVSNPELFAPEKPKEEPSKEEKKNMQPPHLRPSSSPRPNSPRDDKPKKEYTENERRLMRQAGMTEDEWEAYMNAPASLKGVKK